MRYFAYGSNMSPAQMGQRCPGYRFMCVARLADYRLAFPLYSRNWRSWVGGLVPAQGAVVWGVVYEVSEEDLRRLDAAEGVDLGYYTRAPVVVTVMERGEAAGEMVAETYLARKQSRNRRGALPTQEYLDRYLEGARHWALPAAWVAYLEDLAASARSVPATRGE